MNARRLVAIGIVVVAIVLVAIFGLRKGKKYAPSCPRNVPLVSPWAELNLPVSGGRVCESTSQRTQVQYLHKHKSDWEAAYDQALIAAGFTKDRCLDMSCTYKRGADKATLQVIETKSWNTVIVRR
jgi:hypothetical protein